jgi:hypothetical protein
MNLSLPRRKRTFARLVGMLGLGSMLLIAVPAHAATSAPPGRVATNLPNVFAYPAPPEGFDPTGASTTDLRRYGFPLPPDRAKAPNAYQNWVNVMHHAKHYVLPSFTSHPGIKHATTSNWSGAVDTRQSICFVTCGGASASPNEVWGGWTVPSVASSTQASDSSTWVGLDGWGNNQVEQIGTEQKVISFCIWTCVNFPIYYSWFELYPDSEQGISSLQIWAGDIVWADVYYDARDNEIVFFLQNDTTGYYVAFSTPAKYGCGCVSAEWITERPSVDGNLTPLADFVHTHIVDAYFVAASPYFTSTFPAMSPGFNATTINMVNRGTVLAYGYFPGVDQADSLWVNYS